MILCIFFSEFFFYFYLVSKKKKKKIHALGDGCLFKLYWNIWQNLSGNVLKDILISFFVCVLCQKKTWYTYSEMIGGRNNWQYRQNWQIIKISFVLSAFQFIICTNENEKSEFVISFIRKKKKNLRYLNISKVWYINKFRI